MKIVIPEKSADIIKEVDVLVVGGGPAGIGAAVSAAAQGVKVMLLEKRGFLGGNITSSYVETCNHFMYNTPFKTEGVFEELERKYREQFGSSHDIRTDMPAHRFSSEYLRCFLDKFMSDIGIEVKLHSFVNEVVVENRKISFVIIQTKQGPKAVKASVIVDATGDGDVAFSAGAAYEQGRASDGVCQPGTSSFRITGVDIEKIRHHFGGLGEISNYIMKEQAEGRTGMKGKRQWPGFGRLTPAGQISYVNFADVYHIDPTDIDGLTKGEIEGRQHIMEMYNYLKNNIEGMENIEISSIAPEMGFRDSRRIKGYYQLTKEDIENNRKFKDTIAVFPRFYDMLALDGDWSKGRGIDTDAAYTRVEAGRVYEIPYRCLVSFDIDNLLVSGRCICADHLAESTLRAIAACMLTGQAAGTAAALAYKKDVKPINLDVKVLQKALRMQGIKL
jgi:hypothetical protein